MKYLALLLALFFSISADANEINDIYYKDLRHYYHYDNTTPLQVERDKENSSDRVEAFTFRSHDGEIIHASITKPENYKPSNTYPLYIGKKYLLSKEFINQKRFLVADISMRLQGKGAHPGLDNSDGATPFATIWARQNTVIDYRRLLDYIETNFSVDKNIVIAGGPSRFGRIVTILAANDSRIKGVIAAATSSDWLKSVKTTEHLGFKSTLDQPWFNDQFYQQIMAPLDPKYFARYVKVPVLVLHAERDKIATVDGAKRLHKQIGAVSTLITYNESEHNLFGVSKVKADTTMWLIQNFF